MATIVHLQDQLLERCKDGDKKAQSDLYHRYARAMFNVAMRITRDYMEAEDVLQESFVRAFKNLTSFKGDATFGAWLKRIVINTAINHLKRRRFLYDHLDEKHSDISPSEEPESFSAQPHTSQIQWAIKKLPEGYRLVFNLYLIEGYDHQEISHILNISEATSKSQYCRAKKKLRELLTEKIAV